ncbi:hypothetical protein F2Q70_00020631 [Brassica cretica]|uniref:Suppressor of forked domain-containing protein n=1 Tax=Brassica cretica TaxID=69181 RepID=A0A8S9GQV5_BRACR|nr:hypothetical protein F2Q70_00020631 [Brassica cretica]
MYERTTEKLADDEEAETLLWRLLSLKSNARSRNYGGKEEIEDATAGKRRFQYEDEVRKNSLNYDSWFDYVRLEEPWGTKIGVNYALYGETETEDVYRKSPKKDKWSTENCYAWRKYAELERSLAETERSRVIFELAISQPALDIPELLWKAYIDFEIAEGELERTRALYERLLDPHKALQGVAVWVSFANFEASAAEQEED